MKKMDFDQTQVLPLSDEFDEMDDEADGFGQQKVVGYLKVFCQKGFPETSFPVYEGDNVIGRQSDKCNIHIPIKALSKQHACIEVRGLSHMIYDKGSVNKTRKGSRLLCPEVRYDIGHEDKLTLADVDCVYYIAEELKKAEISSHFISMEAKAGDESGSETGSESMFTLKEAGGGDWSRGNLQKPLTLETDEDDNSSDVLPPTQVQEEEKVLVAESDQSDAEDGKDQMKILQGNNNAVAETPFASKPDNMVNKPLEIQQTLLYEEYVGESELEISKSASQPGVFGAEFVEESDVDEESDDNRSYVFEAATQAFPDGEDKKDLVSVHKAPSATQLFEEDVKDSICQDLSSSKRRDIHDEPTMVYDVDNTQTFVEGIQAKAESTRMSSFTSDSSDDRSVSVHRGKGKKLSVSFDEQPTQMYTTEEGTESDASTLPVSASPVKSPDQVHLARGAPTLKRLYPQDHNKDGANIGKDHMRLEETNHSEETAQSDNSFSTLAVTSSFEKSPVHSSAAAGKPALNRLVPQSPGEDGISNQETQAFADMAAPTLADSNSPEIYSKMASKPVDDAEATGETQPYFVGATQEYSACSPTQVVGEGNIEVFPLGKKNLNGSSAMSGNGYTDDADATQPYEVDDAEALEPTQAYGITLQPKSDEIKDTGTHTSCTNSNGKTSLVSGTPEKNEVCADRNTSDNASLEETVAYEDIEPTQVYGASEATQSYGVEDSHPSESDDSTQPITVEGTQDHGCAEIQGYDLAKGTDKSDEIKRVELEATQAYGLQEEKIPESDESDDETLLHPIIPIPINNSLHGEKNKIESVSKPEGVAEKDMQTPLKGESSSNDLDETKEESDFMSPVIAVQESVRCSAASVEGRSQGRRSKSPLNKLEEDESTSEGSEQPGRRKSTRQKIKKKPFDSNDVSITQKNSGREKRSSVRNRKEADAGTEICTSQVNVKGKQDKVTLKSVQPNEETEIQGKSRVNPGRKSVGKSDFEQNANLSSDYSKEHKNESSLQTDVDEDLAQIAVEKGGPKTEYVTQVSKEKASESKVRSSRTRRSGIQPNKERNSEEANLTDGKKSRVRKSLTFKKQPIVEEEDKTLNSEQNVKQLEKKTGGKKSLTFKDETDGEENNSKGNAEDGNTSKGRKNRGKRSLASPIQTENENKNLEDLHSSKSKTKALRSQQNDEVVARSGTNSETELPTRTRGAQSRTAVKQKEQKSKVEKADHVEKPQSSTRRSRSLGTNRNTDEQDSDRTDNASEVSDELSSSVRRSSRGHSSKEKQENDSAERPKKAADIKQKESESKLTSISIAAPETSTRTGGRNKRQRQSCVASINVSEENKDEQLKGPSPNKRDTHITENQTSKTVRKSRTKQKSAGRDNMTIEPAVNDETPAATRSARSRQASAKVEQKKEGFVKPEEIPVQTTRGQRASARNKSEESILIEPERVGRKKRDLSSDSQSSNDSRDTGSKRNKRTSLGTPAREHDTSQTIESPSLRHRTFTKPKIMFTGVLDEDGSKTIKNLGGELVHSIQDCTHLVTDKVRRTLKFLCALGRGIPIVSIEWIDRCKDAHTFIDAHPFLVKDGAAEQKFKFNLRDSIQKAAMRPLLTGCKIHATKSTAPPPADIKEIVKCAGGQYLATMPKKVGDNIFVIVGENEETKNFKAVSDMGIPCVSPEFLLTGLLQQKIDVDSFAIKPEISDGGKNRKRNITGTASSATKKKRN
ncbi:mediator of DNA damage checkpoint protein 1 isoform X2 [Lingula anatina]|uniref:Mediator of DNA damage checkpoint protein 1 n=1 Tax=Lingula anatina TaxID=7574 RepID=A0A1S3IEP2_LINAN|nr:mediator of DNA damage checkpoint protein 1 isoform X1 [Lingula anatina]XP_013396614.1 mediator of DNA damage checkpoint protein 1 isoform X2 [Lingula anatina]|eukprot:XP_013396613.1 mediator of DNA damage checkpoint protein 1 isoform X1 [Lingula anatina]